MARIIYLVVARGGIAGGHKMILRHVEALRELGFDAVCSQGVQNVRPTWLDYDVPFVTPGEIRPDDIIVAPDDATTTLRNLAARPMRVVLFTQNPYYFAVHGFESMAAYAPERFPDMIAVSDGLAAIVRRAFPQARVERVRCFADERLFAPGPAKRFAVAFIPRKRPVEALAIRRLFERFHPRHADLEWVECDSLREPEIAGVFAEVGLFLSLNRLESVGMTALEAMASGALCAGFTGIGGLEYASDANGFWVGEDDCVAAADALAEACDLFKAGGAELQARRDAGLATAREWSYARFRDELDEVWSRLAPEATRLG